MAHEAGVAGAAEVARMLDVTRTAVHALAGDPSFPPPLARLATGPVWSAADVDAWRSAHGVPPPGPVRRARRFPEHPQMDVLSAASRAAGALGHHWVGNEHLWLALATVGRDDVRAAMAAAGLDAGALRDAVVEEVGGGAPAAGGRTVTPAALRSLERSLAHAAALGDEPADHRHLVLALLDVADRTVGVWALASDGRFDRDALADAVVAIAP